MAGPRARVQVFGMTGTEQRARNNERALALLAVGAVLAFCYLAREILLPTLLAIFVAFTVHPLVAALERRRLPTPVAALVGTLVATGLVALIVLLLYNQVSSFLDELPSYEDRFRRGYGDLVRRYVHLRAQSHALVKPTPGAVQVQEEVPWVPILLGTAQGAVGLIAAVTLAVFVLYFSLAEGAAYRRKFLHAAGSDPAERGRAEGALDEIHRDLELYLLNRIALNAALGLVMAIIYRLYGLQHAAIWGLTTGLLHFIPYVGPAVGLVLPVAMAALQYGTARDPVIVGAIYLGLVALQGNVIDPIFLGKQLRLSAFAVFLGSIFWFWIWGPIGLFLAVPLLSAIRIACNYVPRLRMIALFLAA
jgi:predicted PurR-regulated permease PerM